ncbi:hypothetical protein [Cupriavidus sp. UGS-1]|uniref:hypothetical protein n=1 Tax=Cupriavidus sp. UGS-1 TaxID=2899826 RepID=UPI001E5B0F5B|nr:hypothetical protein [Cupriavidus sp. UGS-1]MCD9124017.1 hypothetical protein [Cupriavidus sp. UGS-1]
MGITRKPAVPNSIDDFILGAPDAAPKASAAPVPTPVPTVAAAPVRAPQAVESKAAGRKKPISLTIAPDLLQRLDRVATRRGISRASAFALAVSNFVESEERGAQ